MTDLARHIQGISIVDTHEHMWPEASWTDDNYRDVLTDLFQNYVTADFISAGADPDAVERLYNSSDDVDVRWADVADAWRHIQFTGYGEAVRLMAKHVYGIEEFTPAAFRAAQPILDELRKPGQRLHLLRDRAGLDHIQTDNFCWNCDPDESGPDFFLYDINWCGLTSGNVQTDVIGRDLGVDVTDLKSLRRAMTEVFKRHGANAIAVKSQHAYGRTLSWTERSDAEAERSLSAVLAKGDKADEADRLCLGDWCMARGVELAIKYKLPFKIHTGYYAGNDRMPVDYIKSGNLCALLSRYLDARFVLMHISYPYSQELVSLAKHYRNVYVDLCWAWSIDPYSSADFVRRFIHAAPINKLFAFGGDTFTPTAAYAYSIQARHWLTKTLQAEVDDGSLSVTQAMGVADAILGDNQRACFDVEGTRKALRRKGA